MALRGKWFWWERWRDHSGEGRAGELSDEAAKVGVEVQEVEVGKADVGGRMGWQQGWCGAGCRWCGNACSPKR